MKIPCCFTMGCCVLTSSTVEGECLHIYYWNFRKRAWECSYLVFNSYLKNVLSLSKLSYSLVLSGHVERLSECARLREKSMGLFFLLPNQLQVGLAFYVFKVLPPETDPEQSRCKSQVRAVCLQGAILYPSATLVKESLNEAGSWSQAWPCPGRVPVLLAESMHCVVLPLLSAVGK